MTNRIQQNAALSTIRQNIAKSGHHIYVVSGGAIPRFVYSIGLSDSIGAELILAGAIFYTKDEVVRVVNEIAAQLKAAPKRRVCPVSELGSFSLQSVHVSWAKELMLGALDYYKRSEIVALQVLPDDSHWTIDVPDMSAAWTPATAWRWSREPWTYPVPENATATTNLDALRGNRISEVMRWEEDEWEMFAGAGPDVPKADLRVVPLGTLLAFDKSLVPIVNLPLGQGVWRDAHPESEWHQWQISRKN